MNEEKIKFDENNNIVYRKYPDGDEYSYEYDEYNRLICSIDIIHSDECWFGYETGLRRNITKEKFEETKFKKQEKEFLKRTPISRFEMMEL